MPGQTIRALLLDLDDTLLVNDMETFAPRYYQALLAATRGAVPAEQLLEALRAATAAMWRNDGRNGTNAEVFAREFFPRVGRSPEELMPLFDRFYREGFQALREVTTPDPAAQRLVRAALDSGLQLAITTQPVFPREAIISRLRWAGVGPDEVPYACITSYENMRACKPHPAYFRAVLACLGRRAHECLLAGDSPEADMPARNLGIKTFWVTRGDDPGTEVPCDARGSLADLADLVASGGIHAL